MVHPVVCGGWKEKGVAYFYSIDWTDCQLDAVNGLVGFPILLANKYYGSIFDNAYPQVERVLRDRENSSYGRYISFKCIIETYSGRHKTLVLNM